MKEIQISKEKQEALEFKKWFNTNVKQLGNNYVLGETTKNFNDVQRWYKLYLKNQ